MNRACGPSLPCWSDLAAASAAATSTSTSCRCPAAPTSATTRSRSRSMFRDVLDLVPESTVKVNDVTSARSPTSSSRATPPRSPWSCATTSTCPTTRSPRSGRPACSARSSCRSSPPDGGRQRDRLETGDVIPLDRTGRNPEVEEVLGALSLLLNGGGVGPAARPSPSELNQALEGREGAARSVLQPGPRRSWASSTSNKDDIVNAIDSLNRLAVSAQQPAAAPSTPRSRSCPARSTRSTSSAPTWSGCSRRSTDLGDVGVRVIKASKDATIDTLRQLNPVLTELADPGNDFVKAFNVFLTYPFVDEVVGRDPQVARNLHMGDYTNLSIKLDINLGASGATGLPTRCPTDLPTDDRPDGDPRRRRRVPRQRRHHQQGLPEGARRRPGPARSSSEECRKKRERGQAVCQSSTSSPACRCPPRPPGPGVPVPCRACPACRRCPACGAPAPRSGPARPDEDS